MRKKIFALLLVVVVTLSFVLVACDDENTAVKTGWGETTYEFAEDGSSCIATRVDSQDSTKKETATAKITVAITKPATFTDNGERTYTATFEEEWAKTQIKTIADVPKYTLSRVEGKPATVNEDGNIEYYVGSNDKFYLDEAHTQEITFEETILKKIPTVKVDKVDAQYGVEGVKEYYKDAQNNKYLINDKNLLEKIKSEDDLVIKELLGNITLYVNGVKLASTIEHKKSEEVVDVDIKKLVMDLDNPDCEGYVMYSDEALTKKITNITNFAIENKDPSIYIAKKYLLSLELNGGTNEGNKNSVEIRWNGKYKDFIPNTTKTGYELEGWYTKAEGGTKIDVESIVKAENHTIYANYIKKTNTITFNSKGGSAVEAISAEYETIITAPTDPTYMDHTFEGWFEDENFKKEFTFSTMPANSITLYAKWKLNYQEGLAFEEIEGGLEVSGYTGKDLEITIPSVAHGDKPVISIGQFAFATKSYGDKNNNDKITSINMPSITKIDWDAFYCCFELQSVTLGTKDVTICGEAFFNCTSLNEIVNHENIVTIGSNALSSTNVTQLSFPKLTSLGESAFYRCEALTSISIPKVTEIENSVFRYCTLLNTLELGTLSYIGSNPFYKVPTQLDLVIPAGARIVGNAFNGANLKSLELNDIEENNGIDESSFIGIESLDYLKTYYGSRFAIAEAATQFNTVEIKATSQEPINLNQNRFMGFSNVTNLVVNEIYNAADQYAIAVACPKNIYLKLDELNGTFATGWVKEDSTSNVYVYSETIQKAHREEVDGYWFIKDGKVTKRNEINVKVRLIYPENLTYEVVGYSGSGEVIIDVPDTFLGKKVVQIAESAFTRDPNIIQVKLSNNLNMVAGYAFYQCSNLKSIDLGNGVTSLGDACFSECGLNTDLFIPAQINSFGSNIFASNNDLLKVIFDDNVDLINAGNMFMGCGKLKDVSLPAHTTVIPNGMFKSCTALNNITIPTSVKKIDFDAFEYCSGLTNIDLKDCASLTTIASYAFKGCSSLAHIELNDGLTTLCDLVFTEMPALKTIVIPETLTSIVFTGMNSTFGLDLHLDRLYFKGLNKANLEVYNDCGRYNRFLYNMGSDRFCLQKNAPYVGTWGYGQSGEILINKDYIVLEGNKVIGTYDIEQDITKSVTIRIPTTYTVYTNGETSVQAIETVADDAFVGIKNLIKVTFNNQISSIGARAFKDCIKLANVVNLENLQSIGESAFENCKLVSNINLENALNIGARAFAGSKIRVLKVYNAQLGANMLDGAVIEEFMQTNNNLDASVNTVLTNATINIAKITPKLAPQVEHMASCKRIVIQGATSINANEIVQATDTEAIVISKDITTLAAGSINDKITCKVYLEHTQVPDQANLDWYQGTSNNVYIYNDTLDETAKYDQPYIVGVWRGNVNNIEETLLIP